MQKAKLLVAVLGTLFALPALAEDAAITKHKEDVHVIPASSHTFTSNVSLVSDYLYRGISQTGQKPAIQGGFDYARASGLYAGVWGSSISWVSDGGVAGTVNAGTEFDTYLGYKSSFATDLSYDVGYLRYNYPGTYTAGSTKADTDEIYGALGYKWLTAKYSYSLGKTFGIADAKGSNYIDLSANYALLDTGITLGAHLGKQTYKGANAGAGATELTYTDYKLSASKNFGGYAVGLAYSDTDAAAIYTVLGKELGRGTAVLSLSRSF